MEWLARAIGVFYVACGLIVIRSARMELFLDMALRQLTGEKTEPKERVRAAMMVVVSLLTLLGGAALLVPSVWALPLFLLCALVQAVYLLWAGRFLPPQDADEALGRRRVTNAFIVYLGATALVVWWHANDALQPWPAFTPVTIGGAIAAFLLAAGAIFLEGRWRRTHQPSPSPEPEPLDDHGPTMPPIEPPIDLATETLRFAPELGTWPIWIDRTGDNTGPGMLSIPGDLMERIDRWDQAFQATYHADPSTPAFPSPEAEAAWLDEGRAIVRALEAALGRPVSADERFRQPELADG